ncbi:MAG: hypothetical protein ACOC33_01145 [bacterium]
MSVGNYGTIRPSDVEIEDIDIFYTYTPNRETNTSTVNRISSSEVLSYNTLPTDEQINGNENLLEGLYNLRLPSSVFNQLGIYNIYLRPRVITLSIIDCSVLSSLPTVKGLVIDMNELPENLRANNALQGYKIEYINNDGTKLRNVVRYVVTSNKVVPVSQNVGNTSQRAIRYRFDDAGTKLFLQVTPSSASDVKPNAQPFIGNPDQTILLSNTNFNPLAIEVDLVENTIDTLTNYVGGNLLKDTDNGILTVFDKNNEIFDQYDLFTIKDDVTGTELFEVKERRTNIDETQNIDDVTDEIQ